MQMQIATDRMFWTMGQLEHFVMIFLLVQPVLNTSTASTARAANMPLHRLRQGGLKVQHAILKELRPILERLLRAEDPAVKSSECYPGRYG